MLSLRWSHCRYEGCMRKLNDQMGLYGFCDADCRELYEEDKELHLSAAQKELDRMDALAAFKRYGEPNGGKK